MRKHINKKNRLTGFKLLQYKARIIEHIDRTWNKTHIPFEHDVIGSKLNVHPKKDSSFNIVVAGCPNGKSILPHLLR